MNTSTPFAAWAWIAVGCIAGCTEPSLRQPTSPAQAPTVTSVARPASSSVESPVKSAAIHYRVEEKRAIPPDVESTYVFVADRDGAHFEITSPTDNPCLSVLLERDLDGDGLTDAIIQEGGCGNCCPADFLFVAGTTGERFEAHDLAVQWDTPQIELWHGRPSMVLTSNNEGANLYRPESVTRRFIFEHGLAVLAEKTEAVEEKALVDLRAEQFDGAPPGTEKAVSFDLDGDGKKDALAGTLWDRWGKIFWRVRLANGQVSEGGNLACKRIGVLPEITRGHHDLVCDFNTHIHWNGKAYAPPQ